MSGVPKKNVNKKMDFSMCEPEPPNCSCSAMLGDVKETLDVILEKVNKIQSKIDEQKVENNITHKQLAFLAEAIAEQKVAIDNNVSRTPKQSNDALKVFPIKTLKGLEAISAIESIIGSEGICKNLKNVLNDDVVMQVNVDGVQGKESLRKYTYFYEVLIDYYQISDDDLEDCEDLNDDSLLEEVLDGSNGNNITVGGRGPYERAWTTEATRALIHIRGPMQGMFTEGRQKRTALWLHCTRQLQKLGFRYSAAKVQKKWHNILITYSKNLPKKQTSGYVHWEFFEEMHKYLKDKKFDMYDFKMQSSPYTNTSMPQQQQQQQQPPQQSQQTAVFREIKQAAALSSELMAQYGSNNGNQHSVHTNTADVHMDKSNDEFDEDSTEISELKQPKLEFNETELPLEISHANGFGQGSSKCDNVEFPSVVNAAQEDGLWWKDYFERKLEVEREKIQCQKDLHREQIQFQKMSLVQQEKIERLKIDAINSLTATLQKLVETKNRKTQIV